MLIVRDSASAPSYRDESKGVASKMNSLNANPSIETSIPVSSAYFRTLLVLSFIMSITPILFKITGLASYGYPYNITAILLWFLPFIGVYIYFLLFIAGSRGLSTKPIALLAQPSKRLAKISWVISIMYFYFSFYSLIPAGMSIFDIDRLHELFGQFGTVAFTPVGQIMNILAPIIFVISFRAVAAKSKNIILWHGPFMIMVGCLLLTGKRQTLIFTIFCLFAAWLIRQSRLSFGTITKLTMGVVLSFGLILLIGWQRSGFTTFQDQLNHNSAFMNQEHRDGPFGALGLFYLYLGGGIEVLSVATDRFEPLYKPFSATSTFALRRINAFFDYVDYERDVVPVSSAILTDSLGGFGRIWAGTNLQLYIEGGLFWVISTFLIVVSIYYRAIYLLSRGRLLVIDLMFLFSFSLHQLFIFPLRDQFVLLAYVYYIFWRLFVYRRQNFVPWSPDPSPTKAGATPPSP